MQIFHCPERIVGRYGNLRADSARQESEAVVLVKVSLLTMVDTELIPAVSLDPDVKVRSEIRVQGGSSLALLQTVVALKPLITLTNVHLGLDAIQLEAAWTRPGSLRFDSR